MNAGLRNYVIVHIETRCAKASVRRITVHDMRHYADGWVMCPAVAFPLLGAEEPALQSA